jgi:pyruvate/2-oxoglutarate dehydrogenase complex dihydrolipoamide acyltransferase (E2) component
MEQSFKYHRIPKSRIATFDVFTIGLLQHHISALLEFDVTEGRKKLRVLKRNGDKVSFTGWILKSIGKTLEKHPEAAAYLVNKCKLITFNDINISIIVEKNIGDKKVPIPLVIAKTNEKSISDITMEIENAKNQALSEKDIVLSKQSKSYERLYYKLPAFLRSMVWIYLLKHPGTAFKKMGNVLVTSLGTMGKINGWFIQKSVHPISFGLGSVIEKAIVINGEIKIREILNVTILINHDVIDGAAMARFIKDLTKNIEEGTEL